MKNSIEEDIKDIEKYISFTSKRENFSHDTDWNWNKDLANKIEHILSDYKRLLNENEYKTEKIKNQKNEITILNYKQLNLKRLQEENEKQKKLIKKVKKYLLNKNLMGDFLESEE